MTATYSPEDNKLRLYSDARLDSETYERVRAAGFIWAPKQGLFVAPMWTPEREDLLIELCSEIGDEDTSLVDRAEIRADRFEDYSDKRLDDANRARTAVAAIADNIPFGQPILVGHHSERRARKDAEKIENSMRRAVNMWETSKYWSMRAKGALRHAKYKERPDVRTRRIKKLEADKRKQERYKVGYEAGLKFWQGGMTFANPRTGEKFDGQIIQANRAQICQIAGSHNDLNCAVARGEYGPWTAWDVLRPDGDRYKACPEMTVAEVQAKILQRLPNYIARVERWIRHYENRIAFEREMLGESGGTAADKTGPQVGGACRCWASPRGGWSSIKKVNKVSVTVLDNWGNGGRDFTRTIPFDKLFAVMTKGQVDTARTEGRILAENSLGFMLADKAPEPQPTQPNHQAPEADLFTGMKETLRAGVQIVSAPQLFPTPRETAERMIDLAQLGEGQRILEPSAGTGAILDALLELSHPRSLNSTVTAVEINSSLFRVLSQKYQGEAISLCHTDFLATNGELGTFDRILMNPPFENAVDIKHIEHALTKLRPGGRLVAICANGPRQHDRLKPRATEWYDLEAGTFKASGTMVNAAIAVFQN